MQALKAAYEKAREHTESARAEAASVKGALSSLEQSLGDVDLTDGGFLALALFDEQVKETQAAIGEKVSSSPARSRASRTARSALASSNPRGRSLSVG